MRLPVLHFASPLLVVCFFSSTIWACTCVDYGVPSCKLFGDADAVFIGTIDRITPANEDKDAQVSLGGVGSISSMGGGLVSVQFRVEKAFKGVTGGSVKAFTYTGTSCDLGVGEGQRWLIFANKNGKIGMLGFGACGGNRHIDKNDDEPRDLEQLSNLNSVSTIRGRITLGQYDAVKEVKVSLSGQGTQMNTQSDESGSFIFRVPRPGKYTVNVSVPFSVGLLFSSPSLPPGFKEEEPTEMESRFRYDAVAKPGTCDYQYFDTFKLDLKATASIAGTFVQTDGKNSRMFYPNICRLKATEKETLQACHSLYDLKPNGSFSFDGLREGRYTIVVGDDLPNGPEPYYRHYYPGVKEFDKAKPIEIRQGEQKRGIRFALPPILPTRQVSGQVFLPDGVPAKSPDGDSRYFYLAAYFYRQGIEPSLFFQHSYSVDWREGKEGRDVEMVNIDSDGKFALELFDGFTYVLKVEGGRGFYKQQCGLGKVEVNSSLTGPIRILLDREPPCDPTKFVRELETGTRK